MNEENKVLQTILSALESGYQFSDEMLGLINEFVDHLASVQSAPEVPQGTELLWILSGSNPNAFVSYLQTYPGANFSQLLSNPGLLNRTIQQLDERFPVQAPMEQDSIPKADLNSSNVYGFTYDPKSKSLYVRFNSGSVYGYEGVPPIIFKLFQSGAVPAKTEGENQWGKWWKGKSPSLGATFYELIRKGAYPYQKLK